VTLLALSLTSGCLSSTDPQPSLIHLKGPWTYKGAQTGPVIETLTGTLTISSESGTSFQGQVNITGVNQASQTRVLTGLVSGSQHGVDLIDFDVNVETVPRRHVGRIVEDTIAGTWIGSAPDGTTSSGTFRLER
jgi:hypothetical protein